MIKKPFKTTNVVLLYSDNTKQLDPGTTALPISEEERR